MATANINWTFGPRLSGAPIANCTFSVQVMRDGVALSSFVVTTGSSGTASGVYQDSTASSNTSYQYRLIPVMAGCAANCTADPAVVNWSCAGGTPPPPPPPPPPAASGCPDGQNAFYVYNKCGSTLPPLQVQVGEAVFLSQNFTNVTAVVVTPTVPGLTAVSEAVGTGASASLGGTATAAGTYNVQFTGSKTGCANCVITYPLIVGAGAGSTQTIRTISGEGASNPSSTQVPVSLTSFNSGDQLIQVIVTGPAGQTFRIVATGTTTWTSPVYRLNNLGRSEVAFPAGAVTGYSTTWSVQPAVDTTFTPPSTPITLTNPGSTLITGTTSLVLSVVTGASSYSITVTSPPGTIGVPFTLSFGGALFGNTSALCADNRFGAVNNTLNTSMGNTPGANVFTIGPIAVTAPYAAAIKLTTTLGSSQYWNVVTGPPCVAVTFP